MRLCVRSCCIRCSDLRGLPQALNGKSCRKIRHREYHFERGPNRVPCGSLTNKEFTNVSKKEGDTSSVMTCSQVVNR